MSMTGPFFDRLSAALGAGGVTDGQRTQAEQDALVARGVTRSHNSAHIGDGGGYDISPRFTRDQVNAKLAPQGLAISTGPGSWIPETGVGPNQGTGAHTHVKVYDMASGAPAATSGNVPHPDVSANGQGGGLANPLMFLHDLHSSLGPEGKASQNVNIGPSDQIFGDPAPMKAAEGSVDANLQATTKGIDVLTQVQGALHQSQTAAMTQQVNDSKAITQTIADGTDQLSRTVAPIMQARSRIADQLDKINSMNPIERGIKGIFDLNYDRSYLEGQMSHYETTLQARGEDYDYLNKLHNTALLAIQQRYSETTALPGLAVAQTSEDLGTLALSLKNSVDAVSSLRGNIAQQSQLIMARQNVKTVAMDNIDGPTTLDLAAKAKAAGGIVDFNGVQLSYAELRQKAEKDEAQDLAYKGQRQAIAGGDIDLANRYATQLAQSLNRTQLETAINNGGMYKGIQLPQSVTTAMYRDQTVQDNLQAASIENTMPATQALSTASQIMTQMTGIHSRAIGLLGTQGVTEANPILQEGANLTRQLIDAVHNNAAPAVITALTRKVATNATGLEAAISAGLLRSTGGDKKAAGYMSAFLYGQKLDPAAANDAMTYFAVKGALPTGMAISDESRQVFELAKKTVADNQIGPDRKPRTQAQLMTIVGQTLANAAPNLIGAARGDRVFNSLPQLAQAIGDPFSAMPLGDWQRINQQANREGASIVAKQTGATPDDVATMYRTQRQIPGTGQPGLTQYKAVLAQQPLYNSTFHAHLIDGVNDMPQIQPGRNNSDLMLDLLGNPKFHGALSTYSHSQGQSSFGDFVANPIADGATENFFAQHTRDMGAQAADMRSARIGNARRQAAAMAFDPINRVGVIMRAIDGVGKPGMDALAPTIKGILGDTQGAAGNAGILYGQGNLTINPNSMAVQQDTQVINGLRSMKFQDPKLENYRKQAVKGWDNARTTQMGTLENLLDVLHSPN